MKIKDRLTQNTIISLGAVVLIALSLAWSYREISIANRDLDLADRLRDVALERIMLRDDYLLHMEERSGIQWRLKSETFRGLLDLADRRFTSDKEKALLSSARKNFEATSESFSRLMEIRKRMKGPGGTTGTSLAESESMLAGQIFLRDYTLADSVADLDISTRTATDTVRDRVILLVVAFLFAGVAVITVNSTVINRLLARGMSSLGNGLGVIGSGDLDYRIDDHGDDELSDLARMCNQMTRKLKDTHTSLENLQKEVAERKQAETKSESLDQTLKLAQSMAKIGFWSYDIKTRTPTWSEQIYVIFGIDPAAGEPVFDAHREFFHPEDWNLFESSVRECVERGKPYNLVLRIVFPDRSVHFINTQGFPRYDAQGEIRELFGTAQDITEHRRAEEERERLQALLTQSQKMEAVGRLAGGIAHDFNNLLTVINGYSALLMEELGEKSPQREEVEEIKRAGERAAALTQQLLAFSRKQVLQPKVLDLNEVVSRLEKMLHRLIGENLAFRTVLGTDLGRVRTDPGQIEQVLVNLVVNARDAMRGGGTLTVETANVDLREESLRVDPSAVPGPYVRLTVSDTGTGMNEEAKAHLFEPFFTTKEKGKGTGLGLSMVYGIVTQSGGHIAVDSETGKGTTVRIYLPQVKEKAEKLPDVAEVDVYGCETVLLVEDEDSVREISARVLAEKGYRVLQAGNGTEGLRLFEENKESIDLLVTDVVMPRMGGRDLALRVAAIRPDMKVLYMSGYTDDALGGHGVLEEGLSFLQKPFTPTTFLRKVREVLGTGPPD